MLYNIYGKEINEVFHKESIHLINKIGNEEKKAINDCLQKKIESVLSEPVGKQILTSSFIPGEDWTNTVFQPIYSVAADCNQELAAKLFGLILMQNFRPSSVFFQKTPH